jgi:hypothetical protein
VSLPWAALQRLALTNLPGDRLLTAAALEHAVGLASLTALNLLALGPVAKLPSCFTEATTIGSTVAPLAEQCLTVSAETAQALPLHAMSKLTKLELRCHNERQLRQQPRRDQGADAVAWAALASQIACLPHLDTLKLSQSKEAVQNNIIPNFVDGFCVWKLASVSCAPSLRSLIWDFGCCCKMHDALAFGACRSLVQLSLDNGRSSWTQDLSSDRILFLSLRALLQAAPCLRSLTVGDMWHTSSWPVANAVVGTLPALSALTALHLHLSALPATPITDWMHTASSLRCLSLSVLPLSSSRDLEHSLRPLRQLEEVHLLLDSELEDMNYFEAAVVRT